MQSQPAVRYTPYQPARPNSKANRERGRTHEINSMYESLRHTIPHTPNHLSKIKTLRLATAYIAHLTQLLNEPKPNPSYASASFEYTVAHELRRRNRYDPTQAPPAHTPTEKGRKSTASSTGSKSSIKSSPSPVRTSLAPVNLPCPTPWPATHPFGEHVPFFQTQFPFISSHSQSFNPPMHSQSFNPPIFLYSPVSPANSVNVVDDDSSNDMSYPQF